MAGGRTDRQVGRSDQIGSDQIGWMDGWIDTQTERQTDRLDYRMFIGPRIIVIAEELKTNLMSLVIFISLIICSICFGH